MKRWYLLVLTLLLPAFAHGADPAAAVSLIPHFGAAIPGDTAWRDEHDRPVQLRQVTAGRPTVLVLAYYRCPMLCPLVLQHLAATLRDSGLDGPGGLGVVAASIDPRDNSTVAIAARQTFLDRAQVSPAAVHFLTGPAASSERLAAAVGFHYVYDAEHGEYAHPAEYIVTDADGRVARYLPAFTTTALDLRLALADIQAGRRSNIFDHALLLCYAYDPATGHYTIMIQKVLRLVALLTITALVAIFWFQRRRSPP